MALDDPRRERLAAALRANLRRRKAPGSAGAKAEPPPERPPSQDGAAFAG